jgi:hypothetical protein
MPCHISFRDYYFERFDDYVLIHVTTDVPCHCYARISYNQPQIHRKSGTRRGYNFIEDLRVCFTAYFDREQLSSGDTIHHLFVVSHGLACRDFWFVFWGSMEGETCVSTSPPLSFKCNPVVPEFTGYEYLYEPWSDFVPGPAPFVLYLYEPWTYENPVPEWTQFLYEPWST